MGSMVVYRRSVLIQLANGHFGFLAPNCETSLSVASALHCHYWSSLRAASQDLPALSLISRLRLTYLTLY